HLPVERVIVAQEVRQQGRGAHGDTLLLKGPCWRGGSVPRGRPERRGGGGVPGRPALLRQRGPTVNTDRAGSRRPSCREIVAREARNGRRQIGRRPPAPSRIARKVKTL